LAAVRLTTCRSKQEWDTYGISCSTRPGMTRGLLHTANIAHVKNCTYYKQLWLLNLTDRATSNRQSRPIDIEDVPITTKPAMV